MSKRPKSSVNTYRIRLYSQRIGTGKNMNYETSLTETEFWFASHIPIQVGNDLYQSFSIPQIAFLGLN